jgi:AraC family transcriptional regulator
MKQVINGGKHALFLHEEAYENLSQSYNFIYKEWLMNSEFELRDIPCFEEYLNRDPRNTKPENLKTTIYIPLK